jgi:glycosyltransferase involved in cell wall biosynthesis
LEALAAGVPVIASDIRVSREVCGDFVEYFSLDSEEQLGEKLLAALALPAEERRLGGERGRAWAGRFTWEKAAQATVAVLRRALGKH